MPRGPRPEHTRTDHDNIKRHSPRHGAAILTKHPNHRKVISV
jgi:hypothetical protein